MLTHDAIEGLLLAEKKEKKLTDLPDDFYESVKIYLEKKGKISQSKEDRWEFDWAMRTIQDLVDLREAKIINIALAFVRAGVSPGGIAPEEQEFFEKMVDVIRSFQEKRKEMLEGSTDKLATIGIVKNMPAFVGVNLRTYGPFREGDVANIPEENASLLVEKGLAKKIQTI